MACRTGQAEIQMTRAVLGYINELHLLICIWPVNPRLRLHLATGFFSTRLGSHRGFLGIKRDLGTDRNTSTHTSDNRKMR